jgi:hypothetical protein
MKTKKTLSSAIVKKKSKLKASSLLLKKLAAVPKLSLQRFEQFFALFDKIIRLVPLLVNFVKYPFIRKLFMYLYLGQLNLGNFCLTFCYSARNFWFTYVFRKLILDITDLSVFKFNSKILVPHVRYLVKRLMLKRINRYLEPSKPNKITNIGFKTLDTGAKVILRYPMNATVGDAAKILKSKSFGTVPNVQKINLNQKKSN